VTVGYGDKEHPLVAPSPCLPVIYFVAGVSLQMRSPSLPQDKLREFPTTLSEGGHETDNLDFHPGKPR